MNQKLSTALYDATISGNTEEADRIRSEIDDRNKTIIPKTREVIVNFNIVLNNDKATAKAIYDFLNKHFGADWWEWEMETLEHMMWIHYATALEGLNREKVFAIRHLCNSDRPFFDWYEFNQTSLAFSGAMADFECLKSPSPGMVISAIKTMNHIRPDRNSEFGSDVIRYICILLLDHGVYVPLPSIVSIIQDRMKLIVSKEIQDLWIKIIERFNELVQNKNIIINEDTVDIQAKRLLIAEASAVEYGI